MTMLDRMRQHTAWLKWSLAIVVVAFIVLYIPNFVRLNGTTGSLSQDDWLATVNGRTVTYGEFQRAFNNQTAAMRSQYGGEISDQMLRQLGVPQRIVQQLIEDQAVLVEANRLGMTVSDGELNARIVRLPGFQENGQFVGYERYRQILDMQRPPMRPADFEEEFRKSLLAEKLMGAVTGWVVVSDADVEKGYRERNEKVKLELAVFTANQFRNGIQPTDAEIQAQFNANPAIYQIPEKRRVKYIAVDGDALMGRMTATDQEIQARYTASQASFSTPEQVRASHILFKTEGKDEAAVRKVAESVLAKVKAGGDFAALAKQYSEDDDNGKGGSKANGGDLDYFGKGAMVKEFEEAAWALQPGQVSDLVKSPFGFHIIKVTDKKPAVTKTLAEVRPQLEAQIKQEKAQAEAAAVADAIAGSLKSPADFDKVAKDRGLAVGDSGLFSRDEPLAGLGFAPAVTAEAFTLEPGKVSGELRTNQGFAFITVTDVKPPYVPKVDEVKDKVREDVIRTKAVELARQKANTMAAAAKSNFAAAAKAAGVDVKTTDFITRGTALPEVGVSDKVDQAVFALKPGEVTPPIATDAAVVVARVKEKQDITPDAFQAQRDSLRAQLLQQKRSEFFGAYMNKAKDKMKIEYNQAVIGTILAGQ